MEMLATFGVAGKELFSYNRDYYTFDQKMRLEREMLRLEMQIKRFELFRDDIRDLVELTTGKMEMYHLVGALMMEFIVIIYTEGAEIAWIAPAPPFIKALFAMSLASAFVYILLAVWLSMHASVSAHSFGVRLLTRFVRLPIPGVQQVKALNARLTDFENQGGKEVLRVPFLSKPQQWKQFRPDLPTHAEEEQVCDGDERYKTALKLEGELRPQDLLGTGETAINENDLTDAATRLPGHHVQLFRRLQAKWQCYDCYARVCMSLGAYCLLTSISYYLVIATMKHYYSLTTGYAVITVFMVTNIVLGILDVGRSTTFNVVFLHLFGAAPVYIAAYSISSTMLVSMETLDYPYPWSPAIFFITAVWYEGLLHLAWPSRDGMSVPRRFRTVLFIDVFAVADEALKESTRGPDRRQQLSDDREEGYSEEQVMAAEEAMFNAEAALRRWQAVPAGTSEARAQGQDVARLRKQVLVSRKMLNGEAARLAGKIGDKEAIALLELDTRAWNDLSPEEQAEDPYANTLLGPFQHGTDGNYYYDLEDREFVWNAGPGREVLTLDELDELVRDAETQVKQLLGGSADAFDAEELENQEPTDAEKPARGGTFRRPAGGALGPYVPQRLPWKAVMGMTRALQIGWIFCGSTFAWQQSLHDPKSRIDTYVAAEERRLAAASGWNFDVLDAVLPQSPFFRPFMLACAVEQCDQNGAHTLVVGSDEGNYKVNEKNALGVESLTSLEFPAGTVFFCPGTSELAVPADQTKDVAPDHCLMGQLLEQELVVWPRQTALHGVRTTFQLEGRPWQFVAGGIVLCKRAVGLLAGIQEVAEARWCLTIIGWDGQGLPVATIPLSEWPAVSSSLGMSVVPVFNAPLREIGTASVESISFEPSRGRLWAVLSDGNVQAWELLDGLPRSLGRWRPELPQQAGSKHGSGNASGLSEAQAVAVCENAADSSLLVVARGSGHSLLKSPLPDDLRVSANLF